jgi:hypothetical protein
LPCSSPAVNPSLRLLLQIIKPVRHPLLRHPRSNKLSRHQPSQPLQTSGAGAFPEEFRVMEGEVFPQEGKVIPLLLVRRPKRKISSDQSV